MSSSDERDPRRFSMTLGVALSNLSHTGRGRKQALGIAVDAGLSALALWLAYTLRHGRPFGDFREHWVLFALLPFATVVMFAGLGIYRWVVRSSNRRLYRQVIKGCALSAFALVLITSLLPPDRVTPRSLFVFYGALLTLGTCGVRLLWQELFDTGRRGEPVAIYGAGDAGRQLANLLAGGTGYRPVVFVDDDPTLRHATVAGLDVLDGGSADLAGALRRLEVERLILAMPSLGPAGYARKLEHLERLGLAVQTLPGIDELVSGRARVDEIRDISIDDLLGRAQVAPDMDLIGRRVTGRTVLVTGGGGSIGAELCRQIVRLAPARLVVLDNCEANLYAIGEELEAESAHVVLRLGSVTDRAGLDRLMAELAPDTVYHAAAYKHVPIIEAQPEEGVRTNVFGTLTLLEAAVLHRVSDFVLISTDKAVRPASAMGASKRVAEMTLQAEARRLADAGGTTRISMVRFGNVLGSSGSVVPKFRRQIEAGGPITLTHPDITRYFMTVTEAAQLVLQASAIAAGGNVFVLDMGEPVRIVDLARTMVRLAGRRLREDTGDERDIELRIDGLRPGEKLYEELFIADSHRATKVPKVFTATEAWLVWDELRPRLDVLADAMDRGDERRLRAELMALAYAGREETGPVDLDETLDPTVAANDGPPRPRRRRPTSVS